MTLQNQDKIDMASSESDTSLLINKGNDNNNTSLDLPLSNVTPCLPRDMLRQTPNRSKAPLGLRRDSKEEQCLLKICNTYKRFKE